MPSWQALALNGILRFTMKRHGHRPLDLNLLRARTRNPPRLSQTVPKDFRVDGVHGGAGIEFEVVGRRDRREPPRALVLYFHGGGYLFGSPRTHRQVLIAMSRACDAPVFGPFYRLAPEHPFPAAVEDAEAAYRWLLERYPGVPVLLAGDSAGAGLALATAIGVRDAGLPAAAGLIGFSPYADLAVSGGSVDENAQRCAMFTPRGVREAAALYLGGADPRHPRASPVYADLSRLPPMLLFASRHEILRDDTLRVAERARAAGVAVELIVRDRLPHVWPIFVSLLPEAREAYESVGRFARRVTAEPC